MWDALRLLLFNYFMKTGELNLSFFPQTFIGAQNIFAINTILQQDVQVEAPAGSETLVKQL